MRLVPQFIVNALNKISLWVGKALSDGGSPSASRMLTAVHSLVACGVLIYVALKTHAIPDGMTLTGLGAFSTAHYAVNRATTAWGKSNVPKPDVPSLDVPQNQ
jgi:hypothetical protein